MAELRLEDIQGLILRGYTMPFVRHFALRVDRASAAKRFIGRLVSGDHSYPQITNAAEWPKGKKT